MLKLVKPLIVAFISFFSLSISFWVHFDLFMKWPLEEQAKLFVKTNEEVKNLNVFVWDVKLLRWNQNKLQYEFIIPKWFKINALSKNIVLKYDTNKEYYYDKLFPDFNWLNLLDLTWWSTVKVLWNLTWNCKLHLSNWKIWNLSPKDWKYFVSIPKQIDEKITGWYVMCNNLSSFYKKFTIYPSPEILYLYEKNKNIITPWSTVVLVWKYIKVNHDDNIKLILNGKEIDFKLLSANKLEFKLPNKNIINWTLKVIRNGFESNTITFTAKKYPILNNVVLNYSNKKYFRLFGKFDFSLWNTEVYFWKRKLFIISTWSNAKHQYIDVEYPVKSCSKSSYLTDDYFYVKIDKVASNKLFFSFDKLYKIVKVGLSYCDQSSCYVKIYTNKKLDKTVDILINWKRYEYSSLANLVNINTEKNFITKWYIQLVDKVGCMIWKKYYFDFTDNTKPILFYAKSSKKFSPQSQFSIYWKNLSNVYGYDRLDTKVIFNPSNAVEYEEYITSSIKWQVKYGVEIWTKIKANVSTKLGKSNELEFEVGWKSKYLANPVIMNVLYPNWWEWGQQAYILGYNFSERCDKNVIYFWNKVVYPTDCESNKLTFTIPSDSFTNKILVEVDWKKSNEFTLNTKIGWSLFEKKFSISSLNLKKIINLNQNSLKVNVPFTIQNNLTDIYVNRISFKITWLDYLPVEDVSLEINWNNKQYAYFPALKKVLVQKDMNKWIIKKVKGWYEIIFENLYIPFSIDNLEANLNINLFPGIKNNSVINVFIPSQKIYYFNVFEDKDVSNNLSLNETKLASYKFLNPILFCFDSDKTYKNCSLLLSGKPNFKPEDSNEDKDKWSNQGDQNKEKKTGSNSIENKNSSKDVNTTKEQKKKTSNKQKSKTGLTKKQKIAKKLTLKKMHLLNNVLKKYIITQKRKYWWNKEKILYVVKMYKAYKKMLANTSEDFEKKVKYVEWLIEFAKAYFEFNKKK